LPVFWFEENLMLVFVGESLYFCFYAWAIAWAGCGNLAGVEGRFVEIILT